jgi:hypothetical protein
MNTQNTNDSRRGRRAERLSDKFFGKYIKQSQG